MEVTSPRDHNDFFANDGDVTVIAGRVMADEDPQPEADQDAARGDGSDSGVELNGQDRTEPENTPLDTPTRDQQHLLDYDGYSEGGSESSTSVLSSRPGTSAEHSAAGPIPTPRRRVTTQSPAPSTPTSSRERSVGGRGASCSRASRTIVDNNCSSRTPQRGASLARAQRPTNLMTSSMTASLMGSLCGGGRAASASRAACAASSTPRTARGSRGVAAAAVACRDDGRWPSTVQRAASVSRGRAPAIQGAHSLTSSSSKNSVNSNTASTPSPTVESKSEKFATLPRRRRRRSVESPGMDRCVPAQTSSVRKPKIMLYHETGAQTALTSQDIEDALEGKACRVRPIDAVDQMDQDVQVDLEMEEIKSHLLSKRLKSVLDMLGFDRPQLQQDSSASPSKHIDHSAWIQSLDLLEQKAFVIQQRDHQQRNEIVSLKIELERMVQQQQENEAESAELQEFLQDEKKTLLETLKDTEKDVQVQKASAESLQVEVERLRQECQHLVRMTEQQRQEILTLEARVAGQELRSREALLQQGAAVSGAAVALCALSSRLESLSANLEDGPLEKALAALTAEAEAVTTRTKEACRPLSTNFENAYQTLDNVTEPVLEEEGGHRDSMHSDTDTARLANSESIQNLSAAILNRCLQEEANDSYSNVSEEAPAHLVDQVLDVDTSVTRLLRAIQLAMKNNDLSDMKTMSTHKCHSVNQNLSAGSESYNQKDRSQTYSSMLKPGSEEFCNKEGNNAVSNGIIEFTLASERVTGAS